MRMRYRRNRRTGSLELSVRLSRRETWDADAARAMRSCTNPFVVGMDYDVGIRHDDVDFRYDVSGMRSLRRVLREDVLDGDFIIGAMRRQAELLDWRSSSLASEPYICWLPEFVYVDASDEVRFIVAPIRGVEAKRRDSSIGLLLALSDVRHLQLRKPDDLLLAERVREFAICENGTLSHMRLRAFVEELTATRGIGRGDGTEGPYVVVAASGGGCWAIEEGRSYAMGRAATNDICVLDSAMVSRRHAVLKCDGDSIVLRDLDSMNGTFVEGRRLTAGQNVRLRPGQTFSLSGEVFRIERR